MIHPPQWPLSWLAFQVAFACGSMRCSQWALATLNCAKKLAFTSRFNWRNDCRWWILIWKWKFGIDLTFNNQPVTIIRIATNLDRVIAMDLDCKASQEAFVGVFENKTLRPAKCNAIPMWLNNQPAEKEGETFNNQPAEGKGKGQLDHQREERNNRKDRDSKVLGDCPDET